MNFRAAHKVLIGIERGEIKVVRSDPVEEIILEDYYGVVEFKTSDKWKFGIFFDCGEWDYIDYIIDPDKELKGYDDFPDFIKFYSPPPRVATDIYMQPGYLGTNQ